MSVSDSRSLFRRRSRLRLERRRWAELRLHAGEYKGGVDIKSAKSDWTAGIFGTAEKPELFLSATRPETAKRKPKFISVRNSLPSEKALLCV